MSVGLLEALDRPGEGTLLRQALAWNGLSDLPCFTGSVTSLSLAARMGRKQRQRGPYDQAEPFLFKVD